jgi:hypothetical protein
MVNMRVPGQHMNRFATWFQRFIVLSVILCVLSSCTLPSAPASTNQTPTQTSSPAAVHQETLITFQLTLSQSLPVGESVSLTILDEVTGLAFNPVDYVMTADDALHLTVILPFQLGSVIKYRYTRHGATSVIEHLSNGQPVRYRMYHVEGPGVVQDTLSRWTDTAYTGNTGRITGQITDASSLHPIPNLLITAGGAQAYTKADGSYLLEGLPEGVHNLVAYAIDGMYQTYQQGAAIAANSTTPASFNLSQSDTVPVVFSVTVPTNTPADAPLRLAGNLYQLGNTFADLSGGVSDIASRMPVLSKLPDGRYEVVINLPTGAYIEYKYTLGDGLWNAEHSPDGALMTRRFIVSSSNSQINDTVSNWGRLQIAPITFDVTVPAFTPASDGVSIQFNPGFGWLQPLPMWPATNSQGQPIWRFILISPLEILETIQYRICRADQCGIADDIRTRGSNPVGNIVSTGGLPQTIIYTVSEWAWYQNASQQASIPNVSVNSHGVDFIAGISFDPSYHPSWASHVNNAIEMVRNLGANWLIFSPTWSLASSQTAVSEMLPSQDIVWSDLASYVIRADTLGLDVGIYPTLNFPIHPDQWWQDSTRDFSWWVIWFEHYTQFILHHADFARQQNIDALILGGDWVSPALPHGTLMDGSPSEVPADAEYRWRSMIDQIRERYAGTLIWVLTYPEGIQNPPAFIDEFDKIIINWSAPLSDAENPSVTELYTEAARILDQDIHPFSQSFGKPIILAVMYPSADGSSSGCIPASNESCVLVKDLSTTNPETAEVNLDLQEQADLYNSLFLAVNERDWITGFISVGFYPPVALHDPSLSVYDKPAGGALWYWFPRLLGNQP